jgi:hypothetical protein
MSGSTTDEQSYQAVAELHVPMSQQERWSTIRDLSRALRDFESKALTIKSVRKVIYQMYNDKVAAGHTLSKFSRDFDMSKKGQNRVLAEQIERGIMTAHDYDTNRIGVTNIPQQTLESLNLSYDVLLSHEVHNALARAAMVDNVTATQALRCRETIQQCHEMLFYGVVKMASELALKRSRKAAGDVLTYADFLHQAMLAARDGVRSYQPGKYTKQDMAKAFTTYIHNWVSGSLSKFETENSRTVKLPRVVVDRWVPVGEAVTQLDGGTYEDIAKLATKILHDKRQKSKGTKLASDEVYTAKEVFHLMTTVQDVASLDMEVVDWKQNDAGTLQIVDLMQAKDPLQDAQMDSSRLNEQVLELFREYCTEDQLLVMTIRWAMGEVRGMQETASMFESMTNRKMTKSKISAIEKNIFQKLKDDPRARELMEALT